MYSKLIDFNTITAPTSFIRSRITDLLLEKKARLVTRMAFGSAKPSVSFTPTLIDSENKIALNALLPRMGYQLDAPAPIAKFIADFYGAFGIAIDTKTVYSMVLAYGYSNMMMMVSVREILLTVLKVPYTTKTKTRGQKGAKRTSQSMILGVADVKKALVDWIVNSTTNTWTRNDLVIHIAVYDRAVRTKTEVFTSMPIIVFKASYVGNGYLAIREAVREQILPAAKTEDEIKTTETPATQTVHASKIAIHDLSGETSDHEVLFTEKLIQLIRTGYIATAELGFKNWESFRTQVIMDGGLKHAFLTWFGSIVLLNDANVKIRTAVQDVAKIDASKVTPKTLKTVSDKAATVYDDFTTRALEPAGIDLASAMSIHDSSFGLGLPTSFANSPQYVGSSY